MSTGIFLGFLAYFLYSCADAMVKGVGQSVPIFEVGFFVALASLVTMMLAPIPGERWRDALRMNRPHLVLLRASCSSVSWILSIYAFRTLPLAEAYALIFLMPTTVTVLSRIVLKEDIGWRRWTAVLVGLAGVMLVVRPGFRAILPGHVAAAGVAVLAAVAIIALRKIGTTERRVSIIGVSMGASILMNGVLMSIYGFRVPDPDEALRMFTSGAFAGLGLFCLIAATRLVPANRVGPAQYGQIVWAIAIGALFFEEVPDALALAGMALVGISGLFTFLREEKRAHWSSRTPLIRERD